MYFQDVCALISGVAPDAQPGAWYRWDRLQKIEEGSVAAALFRWVRAELVQRGVDLDSEGVEAVQKIVAQAMFSQRDCDAEMWRIVSGKAEQA